MTTPGNKYVNIFSDFCIKNKDIDTDTPGCCEWRVFEY